MEMMQYMNTCVHLYTFILQKKTSENVVSTAFILVTHVYMILSYDISQMSMNKSLP